MIQMGLLTYYYSVNSTPLLSLTSSTLESRTRIVSDLLQTGTPVHSRFAWKDYFSTRFETEAWLYAEFSRIGGQPVYKNPIYFVLGESNYFRSRFGQHCKEIKIVVDDISHENISFTIPDSMASYLNWKDRTNAFDSRIHGKVYTYATVYEMVINQPWFQKMEEDSNGKVFIEAQVWCPVDIMMKTT
jgi:hypothetical protein